MRCLSILGLSCLSFLSIGGCVLNRTGQSASALYSEQYNEQRVRMSNIEGQFESLDRRMSQTEDFNRSRGQNEIREMETIEELRDELARMRGEFEVLQHEFDQSSLREMSSSEDTHYRLLWFEQRTSNLESALGMERPERPTAGTMSGEVLTPTRAPPGSGEHTISGDEARVQDTSDMPLELESPASESPTDATDPIVDVEAEVATEPESEESTAEVVVGGGADSEVPQLDPSALVRLAEGHLGEGREEEARQVLQRYLDGFPDHEQVPQALYRIAESFYNQGEYIQAANGFDNVVDYHRDSRWAPYAMLRQGECFEAVDRPEDALAFYRALVQLWPDSRAAREAAVKVSALE